MKKYVELDGYVFTRSIDPNKKYDVYKNGNKIASFGARSYEQYRDKIGLYSHKDHLDRNRRKRYYLRHGKMAKKESPKWFSHRYLW